MPASALQSFLATSVVIILLFILLVFLILVVFFGPTWYNPFRADLVVVEGPDGEPSTNTESGYGRFSSGPDTRKTLNVDKSVQVVVLGDIGRSPRMQYHAISLAKSGARVDLIGFAESEVHPDVKSSPLITVVPLSPPPRQLQLKGQLFALTGPMKAIWQGIELYLTLGYRTKPAKFMLVQNPPSIPLLAVAQLICFLRNTRLVIDWHNFGWSVLALKLGSRHPLVIIAKWYENFYARFGDAHFAVTDAMAKYLKKNIGINAFSLHDRPVQTFRPLDKEKRGAFLAGFEHTRNYSSDLEKGKYRLAVSSTSWTADEDFSLLLDALVAYSENVIVQKDMPKILVIITGKGPQKEHYLERIKTLERQEVLSHVVIKTAWLSSEDYALLLGAADLGVSLHQSTSGLDLPMKVVDMFGAGLPVVGWAEYESWVELVKEGVNGRGFSNAKELEGLFMELFVNDSTALQDLRDGAIKEGERRWDDEWKKVAEQNVFK